MTDLTPDLAARLARIVLGHVEQEYPHKLDHVLARDEDARTPSSLHPIFFGSFDWHSSVHGYWLLARLRRRFPDAAFVPEIVALFDRRLTPENVAGECAYLDAPTTRGFERPYGWGWLLKLDAELADTRWSLAPLARMFAERMRAFLPIAGYPVRVGSHGDTAFALRLAADYAQTRGDAPLMALLIETAERWYGEDVDCRAWGEPSGDAFLSPTLTEAECMRRLWPAERFLPWLDRFLPHLSERQPATLFAPAGVSDRTDARIAHLDGLNLSRAWCFRAIADALPAQDPRKSLLREAAQAHIADALPHLEDDYMGAHWLATFVALALEA